MLFVMAVPALVFFAAFWVWCFMESAKGSCCPFVRTFPSGWRSWSDCNSFVSSFRYRVLGWVLYKVTIHATQVSATTRHHCLDRKGRPGMTNQDEAAVERDKYERMWRNPEYHKWSPGAAAALEAVKHLTPRIIDFGCGSGLALDVFRKAGWKATGVDIVQLRPDVVEGCLWESDWLEQAGQTEYGFCVDVLEHIPEVRIGAVLENIAKCVTGSVYLQICTVPDTMGRLIGEKLHLTVKPGPWWADTVRKTFPVLIWLEDSPERVTFLCSKK